MCPMQGIAHKQYNSTVPLYPLPEGGLKVKKKIVLIIILLLLVQSITAHGSPIDYPGVKDEYRYKEMLFITGEPVEMSGTVRITERQSKGYTTVNSTYNLENTALGIKLKRTVGLKTFEDVREDIGQTVGTTTLDKYSETITTPDGKYTLKDYILNGSRITHNKPIADFFSGNWQGEKVYEVNLANRNKGQAVIDTVGQEIGYDHYWGSITTSQVKGYIDLWLDMQIDDRENPERVHWDGDFSYTLSTTTNKSISYIRNEPTQISFGGGYMLTEEQENLMEYSYDLPRFDRDGIPHRRNRERGNDGFVLKTVPIYKRLLIPELKDINGHWAQGEIETLYSLGVFSHTSAYFGPGLPMLRSDFARAIAEAAGLLKDEGSQTGQPTQPQRPQPNRQNNGDTGEDVFSDVAQGHPDYEYIIEVEKRGIIQGMGLGKFVPDGVLTRAQAITIMIRALGFENMAPSPGFRTRFADDRDIPGWAMDSVYAAGEISLVQGDNFGNLNPNEVLSRAEAAVFLYRFIRYLQTDIKRDYRDRILY